MVKFPMLFYIIGEENVFSRVAFKILFSHPSVKTMNKGIVMMNSR